MKAYKASYNGVCRGNFKYEVGQTYETDNIKICKRGFHACLKMNDTLEYYPFDKDFVLFEVELLGEVIKSHDKVVTDKIKIIRVVPPEEYVDFKGDDRGNFVHYKNSSEYEFWKEYDEYNNEIHFKDSTGDEWWKKYDVNNNCIYYKNFTGFELWREYDLNDNLIHSKESNGEEWWNEYDVNNNCIYYKNFTGFECWKKYDLNNNCIYYKNSAGYEWRAK